MSKIVDTVAHRLCYIMKIKNLRAVDIVKKSGISKNNISFYMSGRSEPSRENLKKLAETLNVNPIWLMGYNAPINNEEYELVMIPVLGRIAAGDPNWAETNIENCLPIDPELMNIINPEEYFFLRVNGESMNKIIKNGAFALIHQQEEVENGDIAVVLVNGYEATLKKFTKKDNLIILEPQSTDESFETMYYNKRNKINILGKYVGKMEFN